MAIVFRSDIELKNKSIFVYGTNNEYPKSILRNNFFQIQDKVIQYDEISQEYFQTLLPLIKFSNKELQLYDYPDYPTIDNVELTIIKLDGNFYCREIHPVDGTLWIRNVVELEFKTAPYNDKTKLTEILSDIQTKLNSLGF